MRAGCRPGAAQPAFRPRARRQAAFHPAGQELALRPERVLRREPVPLTPDVRAASQCHRGPGLPSERARPLGPANPPAAEANRGARRAAAVARQGGQPALRPERASRSAQVLRPEPAWWPGRARQVAPPVLRAEEPGASPWAQAPGAPPQGAAEAEACAAEPRREAAWEPVVPRAAAEAAGSGHAAAEPRPEAATAASGRQAAEEAAAEPGGPQAEAAGAAARQGARALQPAEAQRAGEAVPQRAAVRPGVPGLQAARRLAGPSAAASVFRQGQSLAVAGPARRRAARRPAHAMRCWPIASR